MQITVTHVTTNELAAQLGQTGAPLEVSITFHDDEPEYKPSADLTVWCWRSRRSVDFWTDWR